MKYLERPLLTPTTLWFNNHNFSVIMEYVNEGLDYFWIKCLFKQVTVRIWPISVADFANLGKYVPKLFWHRLLWHVTDLLQSFSGGKWILISKAHETITVWLFLGYFNGMLSTGGFMSLINVRSCRIGKRPHLH